jgi:uncharacterized membrane protein YhaH (DUF805 family)
MTFLASTQICVAKYAEFSGRATRAEYWWFVLAVLIGIAAASVSSPELCAVFSVAALVPMIAVGTRRLHDTHRSGWWQLLALVPFGVIVLAIFLALPSDSAK